MSSVRDCTAFNPSPPRLNLAAKDNSQGTRAAVGRSARPPSLRDAPVLIQSMSSHSKPLKTKTSVPALKAADQCPCVKRPIIPTQSKHLASDAACQRDEQGKYPLHIPGTFCWHSGGRRAAKGLPGFKNPPSPGRSAQSLKALWLWLNHHSKMRSSRSAQQVATVRRCCREIRAKCPSPPLPHHL